MNLPHTFFVRGSYMFMQAEILPEKKKILIVYLYDIQKHMKKLKKQKIQQQNFTFFRKFKTIKHH